MTKVLVEKTTTSIQEIDVDFPLYIQVDLSEPDYDLRYYMRIHESGDYYEITKSQSLRDDSQPEYSIEIGHMNIGTDLTQYLDKNNPRYSSTTQGVFESGLNEIQTYFDKFKLNPA